MHITRSLHVRQDVVLKFWDRLQWIWDILVLLNVPNNFGSLAALSKIDEVGLLDHRRNAVFDECKVRQVDTYHHVSSDEEGARG